MLARFRSCLAAWSRPTFDTLFYWLTLAGEFDRYRATMRGLEGAMRLATGRRQRAIVAGSLVNSKLQAARARTRKPKTKNQK